MTTFNAVARDIEYAAEDIRRANHSTMRGVLDGPDTATAVANLVELVGRIPQVLDFLTRSVRRADPTQHYDDHGADPEHTLCLAHGHLDDARTHLAGAADHLRAAHNHLGRIGRHLVEED